MTLHQFGCPKLPVFQKFAERFVAVRVGVTAEKLPGRGRSAGARIKEGNVHFPLRKRTIDKRQVTDDGGKKPKSKTSFRDDKRPAIAECGTTSPRPRVKKVVPLR